jgi:malate/lactate dehydrogenase
MSANRRKVVVIGAGSVGTAYIYALLQTGLANGIALIETDRKRVEGEIMDLPTVCRSFPLFSSRRASARTAPTRP